MTTANGYIQAVIDHLPRGGALRAQVAMELEDHIAQRLESGRTVEEALDQLGDPRALAESYLAATPLVAPPLSRRLAAKVADIAIVAAAAMPMLVLGTRALPSELAVLVVVATLVAASLGFGVYTIAAEYWMGQTLGKHFLGLRVVRESGAAIGIGSAIVRQLPVLFQVYWLDVLFAVFTARQQRAFEMLSGTRVVLANSSSPSPRRADDGSPRA